MSPFGDTRFGYIFLGAVDASLDLCGLPGVVVTYTVEKTCKTDVCNVVEVDSGRVGDVVTHRVLALVRVMLGDETVIATARQSHNEARENQEIFKYSFHSSLSILVHVLRPAISHRGAMAGL